MSIIKRFFLLLFLLLALTTGAAAAGTITDLRTDCLVAGNGSCQVTQTVTIEFTGIEQSLTIPLGANAKRASIAGYRAQKTVEDGYTLFQLKDDAGFAGSRTFTVTYTLAGLVSETDGERTLALPLLCPKWDYPIEHFSFTVTMPKDIETVPSFSSGYYGDVIEDYMTAARQGAVLLGDLDTALKDHESLTMTLALGPRYFTGTYSGWSANWVAAAFCILFALLALGYWFVTLRSPRLSVSSRSLPPDSALPCDLPFLLAGAKPDFNMLLCHWASLGYLSIAVDPQGHVSLLRHIRTWAMSGGVSSASSLPRSLPRPTAATAPSIHYKIPPKSAAGALARFWGRRLYERGSGNVLVMRALAALCSGVALLSAASFLLPVLPLRWLVLVLCFVLGAAMSAACSWRRSAGICGTGAGAGARRRVRRGDAGAGQPQRDVPADAAGRGAQRTDRRAHAARRTAEPRGRTAAGAGFGIPAVFAARDAVAPADALTARPAVFFTGRCPMQRRWASARCSPGNSATRSWTPANGTMSRTCRARRRASMRS